MSENEQTTDDEQVATNVLTVLEDEPDTTENNFDKQLHQFREDRSRRNSISKDADKTTTQRRRIPKKQELKRKRERLEEGEVEHSNRKNIGNTKSSRASKKTTTPAVHSAIERNNEKKKETNEKWKSGHHGRTCVGG